jgi:hypothetical protein
MKNNCNEFAQNERMGATTSDNFSRVAQNKNATVGGREKIFTLAGFWKVNTNEIYTNTIVGGERGLGRYSC